MASHPTETDRHGRAVTERPASDPDSALDLAQPDDGSVPAAADGQYGYLSNNHKAEYLRRLRRIEGQARGLQRMIEDEKYCIDILTQVSAMSSALQSVALGLLDDHLDHCVTEAATAGGDEANEKLKEASQAIARMVRS
jgi:DNA-binding FrmR family transcriptional regulator